MNTERTPINGDLPVTLAEAKAHLRVTHSAEDASINGMIRTAAADFEMHTGIALLATTITHTTDESPGQIINLPVGPVSVDTVPTVATIGADGVVTNVPSGWWLEAGRYPVLRFTDAAPVDRVRITYVAGFAAVPTDISFAIVELVARLYGYRAENIPPGVSPFGAGSLPPAAARIVARYRRVKL
jgi:uncharacterized phiE125 gp8 family phage protein